MFDQRERYYGGEIRPVVDRQLRAPDEVEAVVGKLGAAALGVSYLIKGLEFGDGSDAASVVDGLSPSGLATNFHFGDMIMAHPPFNFRFFMRLQLRKFQMADGEVRRYVDTRIYGSNEEYKQRYEFWLPVEDNKPSVSPDIFAGLEDAQLDNFLDFLGRFVAVLDLN